MPKREITLNFTSRDKRGQNPKASGDIFDVQAGDTRSIDDIVADYIGLFDLSLPSARVIRIEITQKVIRDKR